MSPESPNNCCQCLSEAKVRHSEEKGLYLVACTNCNYYVPPALKESVAIHRWNKINEPHRPCLGCNHQPRLRHTDDGLCFFQCTYCGFKCGPTPHYIGAISHWHCTNLPNNDAVYMLWQDRYQNQLIHRIS